eukprot:COSAG02_NODE_16832_length_1051_cov_2.856243_1_plen_69_part_00
MRMAGGWLFMMCESSWCLPPPASSTALLWARAARSPAGEDTGAGASRVSVSTLIFFLPASYHVESTQN